jgi:hypothetical protein
MSAGAKRLREPTVGSDDAATVLTAYVGSPLAMPIDPLRTVAIRESTMHAALRDARSVNQRDWRTGAVTVEDGGVSWMGALVYFALLDQLGKAVRSKVRPAPSKEPALQRTLASFAPERWAMDDLDRREAMYAVRNAFAHDYALVNVPPDHMTNKPRTMFVFHGASEGDVLRTPKGDAAEWNNEWTAEDIAGSETWVSLRLLGDMVEDVAAEVRRLNAEDELEIALDGGAAEMGLRYFLNFGASGEEAWVRDAVTRTLRAAGNELPPEGWSRPPHWPSIDGP